VKEITVKMKSKRKIKLPNKREDFLEEFKQLITSEPNRKGKSKLATPEEMKSIWKTIAE
jgi:hypothetical protein